MVQVRHIACLQCDALYFMLQDILQEHTLAHAFLVHGNLLSFVLSAVLVVCYLRIHLVLLASIYMISFLLLFLSPRTLCRGTTRTRSIIPMWLAPARVRQSLSLSLVACAKSMPGLWEANVWRGRGQKSGQPHGPILLLLILRLKKLVFLAHLLAIATPSYLG